MSKHNIIESEGVNNHGVEASVFTCTRCGMEDNHRHRIEWEPCVAAAEGADQELDQDLQQIQQLIDEARGFQRYHPVFVAMVGSMAAAGLSQNYNADEAIDATGHICARAATVPAHLIDSRQPKKTMQQARDFLWWMQGGEMPSWLPKEFHHEVMRAEPPEACGNAD